MCRATRVAAPAACHGGCARFPNRAPKVAQLAHVSVHAIPGRARQAAVAAIVLGWLLLYPRALQLRSLISSLAYTVIEWNFTKLSDNGKAFTSLAQFWGNLVYTPVLLDAYWYLFFGGGGGGGGGVVATLLYVLFFPLNVWVLELVLDRLFILCYTRNVAWCYCTYSDAACGGALRLGHGVWWLLMGVGCRIGFPLLQAYTNELANGASRGV
jgi:hypothetical protein